MKKQGKPQKPPVNSEHVPTSTAPKGIEIENLIDYRKRNLTLQEIATLTGCSKENVCQRLRDADLDGLETFREYKDVTLEHKQREIVKSLTDAKVKGMSGLQLITGAAILQDKIQVIRGLSSEIVDHRVLTLDLNKAIEQLRQEQGSNTTDQNEQIIDIPKCP